MARHKKASSRTSLVLRRTLRSFPAAVTGVLSSKREDWVLSIGHLFQRTRSRDFLQTLSTEWDQYVEKGRIKDTYESTEQHKACLGEILDALDRDVPDELRFNTMKKVLLVAATERASNRDSVLPQQYMQLCRTLSSGEILVLLTTYRVAQQDFWRNTKDVHASNWLNRIADESGLQHAQLVEIHESKLIEKNLLTQREYPDRSGVQLGSHFRLTKLGYALCDFIEHSDSSGSPSAA